MKHSGFIVVLSLSACLAVATLRAQTKKPAAKPKAAAVKKEPRPKRTYKPVPVFLGNSEISEGKVSKADFDNLLKQGLTAKDSAGNEVPVTGFWFYYKERSLYEDSAGNYHIGVDLLSDYSKGNKVSPVINANIFERTKGGDTAFFDDILVMMPDSNVAKGIPMKIVITK